MVDLKNSKKYYLVNVECNFIKTKGYPFVNKHKKFELKNNIQEKEIQLEKLKFHVDKSSVCSDLYNKVVLEKAILNKELQDLDNGSLLTSIRKLVPHKKTLICDYFKR